MKQKVVLISPLDWGMGHATRCIQLIHEHKSAGDKVILAGTGRSGHFLKNLFPDETYFEIPGLEINYGRKKSNVVFSVLKQIPAFIHNIRLEKKAVAKIIETNHIDLIISDNRYGVLHPDVKSVLISHQLTIKTGFSFSFLDKITTALQHIYLNEFREIWVPDFSSNPNLSGDLGHGQNLNKDKIKYIGPLSQFNFNITSANKNAESIYNPDRKSIIQSQQRNSKVMALLSGPEPARSNLENDLLELFRKSDFELILVRGTNNSPDLINLPPHIEVINFATHQKIKELIQESSLCIMRSGYSSLMDHYYLGGNILLVPTPGQGEQEYLAWHWNKQFDIPFIPQSELKHKLISHLKKYAQLNS